MIIIIERSSQKIETMYLQRMRFEIINVLQSYEHVSYVLLVMLFMRSRRHSFI